MFPLEAFRFRDNGACRSYRDSVCSGCRKDRQNAANHRRRMKAAGLTVVAPVGGPFVPPRDFLPMGEPDRTVPMRWAI